MDKPQAPSILELEVMFERAELAAEAAHTAHEELTHWETAAEDADGEAAAAKAALHNWKKDYPGGIPVRVVWALSAARGTYISGSFETTDHGPVSLRDIKGHLLGVGKNLSLRVRNVYCIHFLTSDGTVHIIPLPLPHEGKKDRPQITYLTE